MADDSSSSILVPESGTTEIESTTLASKKRQVLRVAGRATGEYADVRLAAPTLSTDYGITAWLMGQMSHDAVDAGPNVKQGFYAKDAAPTDVADADRVDGWALRNGAQVVAPIIYANNKVRALGGGSSGVVVERKLVEAVTISTTQNLFSGTASNYVHIIGVVMSCTTASGLVSLEGQTGGANLVSFRLQADTSPLVLWAPPGLILGVNANVADGLNLVGQTNMVASGMVFYFKSTAIIL